MTEEILMLAFVGLVILPVPNAVAAVAYTIPIVIVDQYVGLDPILKLGPANVRTYDVALLALLFRTLIVVVWKGRRLCRHPALLGYAGFLGALLVSTLAAVYKLDDSIVAQELASLARLASQMCLFLVVALTLRTERDFATFRTAIGALGYLLAATVYLSPILLRISPGLLTTEISEGVGFTRHFGPAGDSIAWLLPFFVFWKLSERKTLPSLFFLGAVFLTGGRGALILLGAGLAYLLFGQPAVMRRIQAYRGALIKGAVVLAAVVLLVAVNVGGAFERFSELDLSFGYQLRARTAEIGIRIFLDNPFLGVGYLGYRAVAASYGPFYPNDFVHNHYVQLASDAGLLGLATFAFFAVALLRGLRRASTATEPRFSQFAKATYVYVLMIVVTNHTAAWLLPASLMAYLMWLTAGAVMAPQLAYLALSDRAGRGPDLPNSWRARPRQSPASAVSGPPSGQEA